MKFPEMQCGRKTLGLLCVLWASVVNAFALDREAFSITSYHLDVRVEPEQHRLGVRGKIALRNDTSSPQKIVVLQISSSLDWRSIKAGDQPLQVITEPYTSDIDHTGSLSEAIVTLPQAVPPKGTVELTIAYEGVILPDATRLIRIGTPDEAAHNADWDQIDTNFTAVRGVGYVAWYPIAAESANLSEGNELAEVLQRWKAREADSEMTVSFESTSQSTILFSGTKNGFVVNQLAPKNESLRLASFSMIRPGTNAPMFVLADYKTLDFNGLRTIFFLPGREAVAASYGDVLGSLDPLPGVSDGVLLQMVAEIPNPDAAPFVSDNLLLMPFRSLTEETRLTLVYALAKQKVNSPRPWITEGLAHFAQALDIEQQHGRKAALDYLNAHVNLLVEAEKQSSLSAPTSQDAETSATSRSLINTADDIYLQSKAMCVWWMLRDTLGDAALKKALAAYRPKQDKEPSYMPKLISAQTQRDLEWFFDDWVYRDRALPDFKVLSAFSRSTMTKTFMVTITIENQGSAGAEVPVIVRFASGQVIKRMEVRAKSKASIRVETPAPALEIQVNDGSVPESRATNNTIKVDPPQN